MGDITIRQKKDWAQTLYLQGDMSQKDIAVKVNVSEKTISKWVNESDWDKLRKSLLATKPAILRRLYDHLDRLNTAIEKDNRLANSKEADAMHKITASIRNLETETSTGEIADVGRKFIQFVQKENWADAQKLTEYFDSFIKERLRG